LSYPQNWHALSVEKVFILGVLGDFWVRYAQRELQRENNTIYKSWVDTACFALAQMLFSQTVKMDTAPLTFKEMNDNQLRIGNLYSMPAIPPNHLNMKLVQGSLCS
jgi:hypothetical protein